MIRLSVGSRTFAFIPLLLFACGDKERPDVVNPFSVVDATGGVKGEGGDDGVDDMPSNFCEEPLEMGMGGTCAAGSFSPEISGLTGSETDEAIFDAKDVPSLEGFRYIPGQRYSLDTRPKLLATFTTPVCGVAEQTFAIPRVGDAKDESVSVTFNAEDRVYEVEPNATDWEAFDVFDLTFRRDITDATCGTNLQNQGSYPVIACSRSGWPTAGWPLGAECRPAPSGDLVANSISAQYCDSLATVEPIQTFFACGKLAVEGTIQGMPAPLGTSTDPPLEEIFGHAYVFRAPEAGEYEFILDGTKGRTATINAPGTSAAEKACVANEIDCSLLGTKVQLAIGSSCGRRDFYSEASSGSACTLNTTQTFAKDELVYFTVLSDTDSGCGVSGAESCDYDYTLWVRSPLAD